MEPETLPATARGLTPREAVRLLRISPDRVRAMIVAGELSALDLAATRCGRPRYVILPQQLQEFVRRRSATPAPKPPRRKRQAAAIDYYPD
jgi:hypothetical protein